MKKRFKLSSGKSKKMFKKSASMTNRRNLMSSNPMRGGIRM